MASTQCLRLIAPLLLVLGASCASLDLERNADGTGTFRSVGRATTLLSVDVPKGALVIARENASDAKLPNMEVLEVRVIPDFGRFNWILDILSFRVATVEGTWGFRKE